MKFEYAFKPLFLFLSLITVILSSQADESSSAKKAEQTRELKSAEQLLNAVRARRQEEKARAEQRYQVFLEAKERQQALLKQARAEKQSLAKRYKELSLRFEEQEKSLTELSAKLELQVGTLGEISGSSKEVYQSLLSRMGSTPLAIPSDEQEKSLNGLLQGRSLPSIQQLYQLWELNFEELTRSGQLFTRTLARSDESGRVEELAISAIGPFLFFETESGKHASWDADNERFFVPNVQPGLQPLAEGFSNFRMAALDPTFGGLLLSLSQKLSWFGRISQGGLVAYIILLVGLLGLTVSLLAGKRLFGEKRRVASQSNDLAELRGDNALGRVLIGTESAELSFDELEYRLEEQILKERSSLELGVPFVKLCATTAPLLGLLGTVTGMISTFQSITVHGTSDPALLAGGISQALVTTMLGLSVAIPLLFAHGLLRAPLNSILDVLEQQAAGALARMQENRAERIDSAEPTLLRDKAV